jgi:preprotein translocase subunit Sss1
VALRSQVGTNTSLATILEHLQSTLIPPPGVPKIDRGSALIPYLKGVYCLSENASDNTNDLEETQVEEGNRFLLDVTVRQPTWEEISEIWKSVGMSFLRWGLIALEVPSQTYATPDGDGGEQTAPMIASGSSSGPSHEQSLKRESKSRTLPLHQARPSVLDYHLPDSAFKIKHHSELRYPEISMRRTLDDPQLAKPGGPSSNQVNGVLPHPQQETKTELETEEVKPKVKKKAFYAEQITGDRGSRAVASTW